MRIAILITALLVVLTVPASADPPAVWVQMPASKQEGEGDIRAIVRAAGSWHTLQGTITVKGESAEKGVDFCFRSEDNNCSGPYKSAGFSWGATEKHDQWYVHVIDDDEAEGNETLVVEVHTLRYKADSGSAFQNFAMTGDVKTRAVIVDDDGEDAGQRFLIPYKNSCGGMGPKSYGVRLTRGDGFRDWYLNSTVEINNAATDQFYYTQGTLRREGGRDHIQPSETWFGKNAANSVRGWRKIRHGDDTPLAQIFSGQGSSIGFTTNKSSGDFNPKRQYCDRLDVSFGNYPHVTNVDKLLVRRDTHDSNSEGIMLEFYGLEVEGFEWEHSEDSAIDHMHLLDQAGAVYAVKDHRSSSTSSWRLTYINGPNCKDGNGCVQGTIDSDEVNSVGGGQPHWLNFEEDSTCKWGVVDKHGSGGVSPKVENNRPYIRNERGYTSRWEYECN